MSLIDNLSNQKVFTKSEIEVINFIKENLYLVLNMLILNFLSIYIGYFIFHDMSDCKYRITLLY